MKKYDFLIDGIPLSVYPVDEPGESAERVRRELRDGEAAVLIYPVWDADFGVTCFDKNNKEPRDPSFSFAALSCFFYTARHFPKMMLELKYREKIYELPVSEKQPEITVNIEKCKILCTKTVKFSDGIELTAHTVARDYTISCTVCRDSELFVCERLSLLLSSPSLPKASAAVAVSFTDKMRMVSTGHPFFTDAIAAGAAALSAEGIRLPKTHCVAELDGREHRLSCSQGKLTFYPDIKYLY